MFIQGLSARQDNAKQKQKHGAGRRQVVVVGGGCNDNEPSVLCDLSCEGDW